MRKDEGHFLALFLFFSSFLLRIDMTGRGVSGGSHDENGGRGEDLWPVAGMVSGKSDYGAGF